MLEIQYRVSPEDICQICELIQLSGAHPEKLIEAKKILIDRKIPRKILITKENLEEAKRTVAKLAEDSKQEPPEWLRDIPAATERWQYTMGLIQAASKQAIGEMYQLAYQ